MDYQKLVGINVVLLTPVTISGSHNIGIIRVGLLKEGWGGFAGC